MFFNFLDELRAAGIPASMKEHLILLEALDKDVIERNPELKDTVAQVLHLYKVIMDKALANEKNRST
jgi:uncharacterized protein with von Willebrand factor type A (vWA) domain